jgi:amino acid transporter/nucleotide-binding universal stress UspA family protein
MARKINDVEVRLRRDLGLFDITLIGVGAMTGASIFVLAGIATGIAGPAVILAIVLNLIIALFTAMGYAELASALPEAGGGYLWIKEAIPQPFGFVGGWISWFGHAIACSFYVVVFGIGTIWLFELYGISLPYQQITTRLLAILLVSVFVTINYLGAKTTGKTGAVVTMIQVVIVAIFVVSGIKVMLSKDNISEKFTPFLPRGSEGLIIAMSFLFIAFEGYEIIAQCGEEVKNPEKNLPRAIFLSLGIITLIYVGILVSAIGSHGWLYLGAVGPKGVPNEDVAVYRLVDISELNLPGVGGLLILIALLSGTLATLNATIYSSSRVSFAMARDGTLPEFMSKIHKKRRTPHNAVLLSGILIGSMAIFLPITDIVAAADIMFLLLFLFVNIAIIRLRVKMPHLKRSFITPLFPLIPICGIVSMLCLAVFLYKFSQTAWWVALAWIECGLILYYVFGGKREIETVTPEKIEVPVPKPAPAFNVLLPVVTHDTSTAKLGCIIAKENKGSITLLNVVETPLPVSEVGFKVVLPNIKMIRKIEKFCGKDVETRSIITISRRPADTIVDESTKSDIIILSWHRISRSGRIFSRTVDKVVEKSQCDVILFKPGEMKEIKSILVISGKGWHVTEATRIATIIARNYNARITILSVLQYPWEFGEVRIRAKKLEKICKENKVKFDELIVETRAIVKYISEYAEKYDLLVMGASDVWSPKKVIMGHIQDRIAKYSKCPVLIFRKVV